MALQEEFVCAWSSFGFSTPREELLRTINDADHDGDMELGFQEFVTMAIKSSSAMGNEIRDALSEMQEVFALFDPNGDGSISGPEVAEGIEQHLGTHLDPDDVTALIAEVDQNGNAEIEFFEFAQMMAVSNVPIKASPSDKAKPMAVST